MKLTVDIVEDFIASLDLSGKVNNFVSNGSSTTLFVDKTFHARNNMQLIVDGTAYLITTVINNTSITVAGEPANPSTYTVPNPFYFHGTPILTNSSINGAPDFSVLPMIYLYEILREKDLRENSRIRRESDLRLFFLDNANFGEWGTEEHYSERLLGLNNLVDEFIEAAKDYTCCFYLYETDFTRINHANWGKWKTDAGHEKRIFDKDLTGVELSFTLPLKNC